MIKTYAVWRIFSCTILRRTSLKSKSVSLNDYGESTNLGGRTSGSVLLTAMISLANKLNWLILNISSASSPPSWGILTGFPISPGPSGSHIYPCLRNGKLGTDDWFFEMFSFCDVLIVTESDTGSLICRFFLFALFLCCLLSVMMMRKTNR